MRVGGLIKYLFRHRNSPHPNLGLPRKKSFATNATARENPSESIEVNRPNVASLNNKYYNITGPEYDALVTDLIAHNEIKDAAEIQKSEATFEVKWATLKMDPSHPTLAATTNISS